MKVGAPLFAFFAKGGHDADYSADFDFARMSRHRRHLTASGFAYTRSKARATRRH